MENNWYIVLGLVVALVIGGIGGANYFASESVVEVPGETITRFVDVPGENVTVEVPLEKVSILSDAVAEFLAEVRKDSDLRECGGETYGRDEFELDDLDDEWVLEVEDLGRDQYSVTFTGELEYNDEDKCNADFEATVEYNRGDIDVDAVLV